MKKFYNLGTRFIDELSPFQTFKILDLSSNFNHMNLDFYIILDWKNICFNYTGFICIYLV